MKKIEKKGKKWGKLKKLKNFSTNIAYEKNAKTET